jgi:hypothetical protein
MINLFLEICNRMHPLSHFDAMVKTKRQEKKNCLPLAVAESRIQ